MNVDLAYIPWPIVLLGLEFPAVLALVDCLGREADDFADGEEDKRGWVRWLIVAVVTVPVLIGFLIIVAYYQVVVKRHSASGR